MTLSLGGYPAALCESKHRELRVFCPQCSLYSLMQTRAIIKRAFLLLATTDTNIGRYYF